LDANYFMWSTVSYAGFLTIPTVLFIRKNITAALSNFNKNWKAIQPSTGLRARKTRMAKGPPVRLILRRGFDFVNHSTDLFSPLYFSYNTDTGGIIRGIDYGRRRPSGYGSLNPFVFFVDKFTYLRPILSSSHSYR